MPQQLPSKERNLFQQVVRNYENKQYKKGLKAVEQILKKIPNHGDTQAMKALILNSQGHTDDAFDLAKTALKNDMKSHVCWHVYGLLYRSAKNFEESIKAYKFALKLDPESQQIQRDLALLQIQMRDYPGYVQSRRAMLQSRPALRQNWTALAVSQHLDGDLEGAERTLNMYEESLRTPPTKTDIEHQECQLYKNNIISEMGQTERALEHLDAIAKGNYDKQSIMETRAEYLVKLGRRDEAAASYRTLLERNLENRAYYIGLEKALEMEEGDVAKRKELYTSFADKSKRADAPQRIPLDFLQGDEFREAAESYLQRMLAKGVPSTFANLKTLYADPAKQQMIQDLAEDFASGKKSVTNGDADASKQEARAKQFELYTLYFLAQHYDYYKSRNLDKAMDLIDQAIAKKPETVDFQMTRARIFKHRGDIAEAAKVMEQARALDERDRYINTKAAKYQLRNDEHDAALENMGKFTRQDAVGGALGDLIDMQCMWFLYEDGASYLRENRLGLALKRFASIYNVFDVWQEDQFDFHTFSMRRGQVRAYVDLLRFEDRLREHPFWTRAAVSAIQAYILLHDFPHLARGSGAAHDANGTSEEDAAAAKKAAIKAKKEKEKKAQAERDKRDAKKTAGKLSEEDKKKEDKDPEGHELLKTAKPLDEAMKFLTPMLERSPQSLAAQQAGFELYLRRQKPLPALRCLLAAQGLGLRSSASHSMSVRLALATLTPSAPSLPPAVLSTLTTHLSPLLPHPLSDALTATPPSLAPGDVTKANDAFLAKAPKDPYVVAAAWDVRAALDPAAWKEGKEKSEAVAALVAAVTEGPVVEGRFDETGEKRDVGMEDAEVAVRWCRDHGVDAATLVEAAKARWQGSTCFRAGRA